MHLSASLYDFNSVEGLPLRSYRALIDKNFARATAQAIASDLNLPRRVHGPLTTRYVLRSPILKLDRVGLMDDANASNIVLSQYVSEILQRLSEPTRGS